MNNKGPLSIKELKALSPGEQIWGKYLLLEVNRRRTKDGKEMYNIKLSDTTGEIDAVVWENCQVIGTMEAGLVVGLLGDLNKYNGKNQITAKRLKIIEENPYDYLPGSPVDIEKLKNRLTELIAMVGDNNLRMLLKRIFNQQQIEQFSHTPAAKKIHHNYAGGLLEHSISIAELSLKVCDMYHYLNRDLLLTGALLHDIGKIAELELKISPQYTVEGKLLGHIVLGNEIVADNIAALKMDGESFPSELEWMLKHMILSHHGTMEFGSPVIPLFPEAFVLHMMDNLDAKLFVFMDKTNTDEGGDEFFTSYDNYFAQQFFKYRYPEAQDNN